MKKITFVIIILIVVIFGVIILVFTNPIKEQVYYPTCFYNISKKHVFLGMTLKEVEHEIGEITYDEDGRIDQGEHALNILFHGQTLRVESTFIFVDDRLACHNYSILMNEKDVGSIINKYLLNNYLSLVRDTSGVFLYNNFASKQKVEIGIRFIKPRLSFNFCMHNYRN